MNTTALNRSPVPQPSEKPSKTNTVKAAGDGLESMLFSGMLQHCLETPQQGQDTGEFKPTGDQKILADVSLSSEAIKSSTSMTFQMQAGQQVVSSAPVSLESSQLFQNSNGTAQSTIHEDAVSALSNSVPITASALLNLQSAPVPPQTTSLTDLNIAGNTPANASLQEVVKARQNAAGHPLNSEDEAMIDALKSTGALPETVLDQHQYFKSTKTDQVNSQEQLFSEAEKPQSESYGLNLKSIVNEGASELKGHTNRNHQAEATVTAQLTSEGTRNADDALSKQKVAFIDSNLDTAVSQPSNLSLSEGSSRPHQLPKSASVQDLPVIWTQHAQLVRSGETKILRMMLNPEQLGALEIELSLKNGILSGIVSVETELAHELIQKQLPQFLSTLDSKHIAAGTFEMHYRGENGGLSDPSGQDRQNRSADHNNTVALSEMDQGLQKPQEPSIHNPLLKRIDILA